MAKTSPPTHRLTSSKTVTQISIDKRIAEGVRQEVREAYRPWIKIRSVPSRGSSHVVPGVKIYRIHHLLSKAEYHYHVLLENDSSVIDIREQFPPPAAETHAIASSLQFKSVFYPSTPVPHVFTIDFLVTVLDESGKEKIVARSFKYRSEIEDPPQTKRVRMMEKLEIEKTYWARRNVEWKLVLYERLPAIRIQNLLLLRGICIDICLDSHRQKCMWSD